MVKTPDDAPSLNRQGRYSEAASHLERARDAGAHDARSTLSLVRVYLRAGHARRALDVLSGWQAEESVSPGLADTLQLETLWAELLAGRDIEAVLAEARRLRSNRDRLANDHDRLSADAVGLRLESAAANFNLLTKSQIASAAAELQSVRAALESLGEIDDAYPCAVAGLPFVPTNERGAFLVRLAAETQTVGRLDLAADASIRLAELRLAANADEAAVRSALLSAREYAESCGHVLVPLDADRIETRLKIDRSRARLSGLEAVVDAYRALDVPARALDTLISLSNLAHLLGNAAAASRYRQEALAVAQTAGLTMFLIHADLSAADLFVRSGDTSLAAEICREQLNRAMPRAVEGAFRMIKASAHGFDGNAAAACLEIEGAMRAFGEIGRADMLSNARRAFLGYRMARGEIGGLADKAIDWAKDDERRGDIDGAITKFEIVADIRMAQHRASQGRASAPQWLDFAAPYLDRAEALAANLTGKMRAQRLGGILQHRGLVATHRQDAQSGRRSYLDAASTFADAGLAMEAANSRLMAGLLAQDQAGILQGPNGDRRLELICAADTDYEQAYTYYSSSMMRREMARVLYHRARLRVQARPVVTQDLAAQFRAEALELLANAETILDELRASFSSRTSEGAWSARRAAMEQGSDIYPLALTLLSERSDDLSLLWSWNQRSKARALGDILALRPLRLDAIEKRLSSRPELAALLREESDCATALRNAPAADWPALRIRRAEILRRMGEHTELAEIADQQSGRPPELKAVQVLLAAQAGPRKIFIEWIEAGSRLGILAITGDQLHDITWVPPPCATPESIRKACEALGDDYFRRPDALAQLAPFAALLAPLEKLSRPGDHLILSFPPKFGVLPLHALPLSGEPLLCRNSISYSVSAGMLTATLNSRSPLAAGSVAIFADPSNDSPSSLRAGREIAAVWSVPVVEHEKATRANFKAGVRLARLSHFQGHAGFDRGDPIRAHLLLADGALTAADIMEGEIPDGATAIIVACQAGAAAAGKGNEPMGLPIALMLAGAASVIAPLWPVHEDDAARFSILLHQRLREANTESLDQVLQSVQLQFMREGAGFQGWAPYVLQGSWKLPELVGHRGGAAPLSFRDRTSDCFNSGIVTPRRAGSV